MVWTSAAAAKRTALALIATALAAIAAVLCAGQEMVAIQGPGTLGVTSAGTLWVVVNDDVWVLGPKGELVAAKPVAELGLAEPPSNIVPLPDGNVLVATRADEEWLVLDPRTLARVRGIRMQWPHEFDGNVRALHVAVSQAYFAVATGGGHAVLLFDKDGRYLRRTVPGTYYFTNGLWWSPDGWWTTDTNRSRLHLLDTETLAVKRTVQLVPDDFGDTALGEFIPYKGAPPGANAPLATVTRLGALMEWGYAADVFEDGTQALFNGTPVKWRDIAWFNGELVGADGDSFRLLRFDASRKGLEPFGDTSVRAALGQMRERRERWALLSSRWGLLAALLLFLAGVAFHARSKKLATMEVLAARPPLAAGSPPLPAPRRVGQRLWIFGIPVVVRLATAGVALFVLWPFFLSIAAPHGLRPSPLARLVALEAAFLPLVAAAMWQAWRHERLMREPRYEPVLNQRADTWLREYADWEAVARPQEVPRESILIVGWPRRWLLVTSQRVLVFAASARERRLQGEWPRGDVVYAGPPEDAPGGRRPSLIRRLMWPVPNLVLVFAGGCTLKLRCASAVSAGRAARVLMTAAAVPARRRGAGGPRPRRRWHEVLLSFVAPGTGQWLQGRFATGTVLFAAALIIAVFVWGPVLWASTGPKTHVSSFEKGVAGAYWLFISLAAAMDAFPFAVRARR